ncbi:hypothetical protein LEP1GSC109_3809, partial [Leptospira interrogans str. UI 13372]
MVSKTSISKLNIKNKKGLNEYSFRPFQNLTRDPNLKSRRRVVFLFYRLIQSRTSSCRTAGHTFQTRTIAHHFKRTTLGTGI